MAKNKKNKTAETNVLKKQLTDIIKQKFEDAAEQHKETKQKVYIYSGPTNSGKTFNALQKLNNLPAGSKSVYLAPLRLLAAEVYTKLNQEGITCSLLTGQEKKLIPNSLVTASTVEMFNKDRYYHTVVLDETQMCGEDPFRGHSWTEVLLNAQCDNLIILCAPHAVDLISKILVRTNRTFEINKLERFTELAVAELPEKLEQITDNSIVVAFSKNNVLEIKEFFENQTRKAVAIYGALPPETRLSQVAHFNDGSAKLVVATDCIGMGLNLPCEKIIFSTVEKFDGQTFGKVEPALLRQIAGRAGRYGYFQKGIVGALNPEDLNYIRYALSKDLEQLAKAYYAPSFDELQNIKLDSLYLKLEKWASLSIIPANLKDVIKSIDLTERMALASQLLPFQEKILGLEKSYLLVNAPVNKNNQSYWLQCVDAICKGRFLPSVKTDICQIGTREELDIAEAIIHKLELYSWIGYRRDFSDFATEMDRVSEQKIILAEKVDKALWDMHVKTQKNCLNCDVKLPMFYKFKICQECFHGRN